MITPLFRTSLSGLLTPWLLLLNTPSIAQIPTLEKNKPETAFPSPTLPEPNGNSEELVITSPAAQIPDNFTLPPARRLPYPDPPEAELVIPGQLPVGIPPTIPIAPPVPTAPSEYLLGGGDRLTIDIFEVPQYGGIYQIPVDGVLYLPLIGSVPVAGLTVGQATENISSLYSRYLKRPLVTIRLLNTRPPNVFVSGEVKQPGSFTIDLIGGQGDNPGVQLPTLSAALKAAGGITLSADIARIQVRRRRSQYQGDELITVNLQELIQRGDRTTDLSLRDGDTVFVPMAPTINLREMRKLALLDFAADVTASRTVAVVGEVRRPGAYNVVGTATVDTGSVGLAAVGLTGGLPTVTAVLQQAGGIKSTADLRNIQVRRLTQTGVEQILTLNLWELLQAGDIAQDTVVQEGDTIIIPKATDLSVAELNELASTQFSPSVIQVSVVGEVGEPGRFEVPPNTTLNQALLIAGGFNRDRAYSRDVHLLRLNDDGTVTSRLVPVDLSQGVNEVGNPFMQDNDILVVRRNRSTQVADAFETFFQAGPGALAVFSIPSRIFGILESLDIVDFDN
ncbi:MAG: polysaccharide export protein [Spirulina sp. SIO3F2]|nr:polysaccharide export protein [Spirulina sp. SIO3F2]